MIKRLVLENYRVYDKLDMSFDELQIIRGRNGIGKTSIVEAIGFALFGSALQRGKANEWIKEGEKNGSVTLYIDDYRIHRSNTLATVEDASGEIIARNRTGINEWVENTYGLTAELYRTSFYIGQKDIGAFAALGPLERTKRVEKLLRIDRLDAIKVSAKAKAVATQVNLTIYTNKLEGSNYNEVKLTEWKEDLARFKQELSLLEPKYEELLLKKGAYNQQIIAWREKLGLQREFQGIVPDLEELEAQYSEMLENNAKVEGFNKLVREKIMLGRNLKDKLVLEKYFNIDIREIVNHEKALKLYKSLNSELDRLDCFPINHDIAKIKAEIKEQQTIYNLNIDIPENCPTCEQPWPEKVEVNLTALAEKISTMENTLKQCQREKRAFDIKEELVEPVMDDATLAEAVSSLEHKTNYLRYQELEDIPEELKVIEKFHTDMPFARRQKEIATRLDEMKDVSEPEVIDTDKIKKEIGLVKIDITSTDNSVRMQESYKAIEEEFSGLKDDAEELLGRLKEFIKFIDVYRKAFGANVIPLLEANVSNIVSYLSEGKYESVKINPDYGIDNFDFYSGSEQDSINFALRLAIAQVSKLGGFSTMLLDEIAASFDEEREALLMDILKQQSNQLIYITHGAFSS